MRSLRLILLVLLTLVVVVIALQNTESVETKVLVATITMPRAVLIFTATAIGFALGVLTTLYRARRDRKPLLPPVD